MEQYEVNGDEVGIWDGFAYIVYGDIGREIVKVAHGDETDTFLSLNDCLKEVGYDGNGVCTVILESWSSGKVYRYGNYIDKKWYIHGKTYGFA